MNKLRGIGFVIFLLVAVSALHAQESKQTHDGITQYIKSEMTAQKIPGVALLISRNGKIERAEGFGFSNVELQVPVKPETIFQSGSMGKQFTATAVMMLVEEGKIKLDEPITTYLKEGSETWKQVTVRQLLSHTGGFTDYPENFNFRKDYTEDEELKLIENIPLAYPTGTKWAYSNMGYATLGFMIHRVSGQFYGDFLHDRVFKPLGMTTTRIISEADIIPNRASGYRLLNGELKNQEWVAPATNTTADGSMYFSILDLAKWDAALYTERVLKRASLEEMWTPAKLNDGKPNSDHYGFGWVIDTKGGHKVIEHSGTWQGFHTNISRYVDDRLTVVVLTNLGSADPMKITDRVAEICLASH